MCELVGYFPESVRAYSKPGVYDFAVRYTGYDVWASFIEGNYIYAADVSLEKKFAAGEYKLDGCYESEFKAFHALLDGGASEKSPEDFIAPVFIMNAMKRALDSGNEEIVNEVRI